MAQESGFNPSAVNSKEGANGLLQWRLDRWQGLQDYAKSVGKSPNDPGVQMDFIGREFAGPEKRAGAAFMAAPDLDSASAALKGYIRYGDDSAAARLGAGRELFAKLNGGSVGALSGPPASASAGVSGAGASGPVPAPDAGGSVTADGPVAASAAAPVGFLANAGGVGAGLQNLGKQLSGEKVEFLPAAPLQMPQANVGQSQQIAAALAKAYGFGG